MNTEKRILLHVCCGPCSTASIERLLDDQWDVDIFFSNSNIAPYQEYCTRLDAARRVADFFKLQLIEDSYDHEKWLEHIAGFEQEPERGARCGLCFEYSLTRTAEFCQKGGYSGYTTSLTVSPHKNSDLIFSIGKKIGGFIEYNFKKKDGFKRSIELSRQLELYRQDYCGCEFSMR